MRCGTLVARWLVRWAGAIFALIAALRVGIFSVSESTATDTEKRDDEDVGVGDSPVSAWKTITDTLAPINSIATAIGGVSSLLNIANTIMNWAGVGPMADIANQLADINNKLDALQNQISQIESEITAGFGELAKQGWEQKVTTFTNGWAGVQAGYLNSVAPGVQAMTDFASGMAAGQPVDTARLDALSNQIVKDVLEWSQTTWTNVLTNDLGDTSYSVAYYSEIVRHRMDLLFDGKWVLGDTQYYTQLYSYVGKLLSMQVNAARLLIAAFTYLGDAASAQKQANALLANSRTLLLQAGWPLDVFDSSDKATWLVQIPDLGTPTDTATLWRATPPDAFDMKYIMSTLPTSYDMMGWRTWEVNLGSAYPNLTSATMQYLAKVAPDKTKIPAWLTKQGLVVPPAQIGDKGVIIPCSADIDGPSLTLEMVPQQTPFKSMAAATPDGVFPASNFIWSGAPSIDYEHLASYPTPIATAWCEDGSLPSWTMWNVLLKPWAISTVPARNVPAASAVAAPKSNDYIDRDLSAFAPLSADPPPIPVMHAPTTDISPEGDMFDVTLTWDQGGDVKLGQTLGWEVFDASHLNDDGSAALVAIVPLGGPRSATIRYVPMRANVMYQIHATRGNTDVGNYDYSWPATTLVKLFPFVQAPQDRDLIINVTKDTSKATAAVDISFSDPAGNHGINPRQFRLGVFDPKNPDNVDLVSTGEPVTGTVTMPQFTVPIPQDPQEAVNLAVIGYSQTVKGQWQPSGRRDFKVYPATQ